MAKIKDINGDGKRNFKDTWLGEKLLAGGKTKGPNLKESMAGARRESPAAPVKATATKAKPAAKAAAKPTATKSNDRRSGAVEPVSAISGASRSTAGKVNKAKTTPVRLGGTPATSGSKIMPTKSRYDSMTPDERKANGLPFTWADRLADSLNGKTYDFKPEKPTVTGKARPRNTGKGVGMAKGGMVSKKGKC